MRPIIVVMDLSHERVTCHWQWDTPVGHGPGLQMKVVTRTSFNARSGGHGTSHGGLRPHQTSLQMATATESLAG
jgi:hypothetical protein